MDCVDRIRLVESCGSRDDRSQLESELCEAGCNNPSRRHRPTRVKDKKESQKQVIQSVGKVKTFGTCISLAGCSVS